MVFFFKPIAGCDLNVNSSTNLDLQTQSFERGFTKAEDVVFTIQNKRSKTLSCYGVLFLNPQQDAI